MMSSVDSNCVGAGAVVFSLPSRSQSEQGPVSISWWSAVGLTSCDTTLCQELPVSERGNTVRSVKSANTATASSLSQKGVPGRVRMAASVSGGS